MNIWKEYKGEILFVLFILQIILVYKLVQFYYPVGYELKTFLDDKIPLIPFFAVFYLLICPLIFLPFIYAYKNKRLFYHLSLTFFLVATFLNIFYVLFQTTVPRPDVLPSGLFGRLVAFIYSFDKPLCCFPSGHAAFSLLVNLSFFKIKKKVAYYLIPLTVLIFLSTLFIKQHYVLDIVGGAVVAVLGYYLVFGRLNL